MNLFRSTIVTVPKNRSPLRRALLLIPLVFVGFALSPMAEALLSPPPPDGGYPGQNTAEGENALLNLTTGSDNTAVGFQALFGNMIGISNTGVGARALQHNGSGPNNTAVGADALNGNLFGALNTAVGVKALFANTGGIANTAVGGGALATLRGTFLQGATENTAVGANALGGATIGRKNIAVGRSALGSVTTGDGNIAVGVDAGSSIVTGNSNIDIGNSGLNGDTDTIRIGMSGTQTKTFIAGIRGQTVPTGVAVIIGSNGRLGTMTSSGRFKEAIQPMDKASEAILALKPVTFRYKHEFDPDGIPQFGLVAEQVEKVNSDLVVRDDEGNVTTVRYEAVNAMLLNEFLKEHHKVQEQEQKLQKQAATIVRQQKDFESKFAQQQKQIEALTAGLQKVTTEIESSNPTRRVVSDN
jgi:trimeric autotransporter adhesin